MPAGPVRLQDYTSPGFTTSVVNGILASSERPARHDATLQVGSQSQQVTVNAQASQLETSSSSVGLAARNIGNGRNLGNARDLPLNARNFTNLQPRAFTPPAIPADIDAARECGVRRARSRLGDLFEYKLKQPITIAKNRSALVPIVQSTINAEKVSVWNERAGLPRPQRALWITNSSGLTLDGGSFSVLEEDTFAGEGIFDPIRPDEKRLVSYATDLALNASSRNTNTKRSVSPRS